MTAERIFADTNLFLRYLTNDIPAQADAVEALLRRAAQGELVLVITSLVIAEIIWTLESYYGLDRSQVQRSVLAILNTPGLEVADREVLFQAVLWYAEKRVDFIDAFNAAWMSRRGLARVCTVDRNHFRRFEGLNVLVPGENGP